MPNKPERKRRPWKPERKPFARRSVNFYKFYNSTKWRKVSIAYREKYPTCECVECVAKGLVKKADVVDHKKGLRYLIENNIDPYDFEELQSMNHSCHNRKSGKQSHGIIEGYGVKTREKD